MDVIYTNNKGYIQKHRLCWDLLDLIQFSEIDKTLYQKFLTLRKIPLPFTYCFHSISSQVRSLNWKIVFSICHWSVHTFYDIHVGNLHASDWIIGDGFSWFWFHIPSWYKFPIYIRILCNVFMQSQHFEWIVLLVVRKLDSMSHHKP